MPNAWFYYLFPLAISVAFVIAGGSIYLRFARGTVDSRGKKYGRDAGCFGVLFAVVGGISGTAILTTSPPPWRRQALFNYIFHTPPDHINRFVIRAGNTGQYRPLNYEQIVIGDRARIRRMAEILNNVVDASPNHPRTIWTARIEMDSTEGTYYFEVSATELSDPNGTLIGGISMSPDGGGWNLGDFRANGLEKILEEAVKQDGNPDSASPRP